MRERRPVFAVRDLAPPPSRWSRPASESAGAPWSLRLAAPPPLPQLHLIFHANSTSSTFFPGPSSFSASFHLLQPLSLHPSLYLSLRSHVPHPQPDFSSLTPWPPSLPPLPSFYFRSATSDTAGRWRSTSPRVLLALQAPVRRHGDIRYSAFVKVNVWRVGERLENHRRQSSLTRAADI